MRKIASALLISVAVGWLTAGPAASLAQSVQPLPQTAPDAVFQAQSKEHSLAEFRGRKVMLWLLSTWCPSCAAGLEALAEKQPQLEEIGLTVLALRNHENGGFPGPSITEFVQAYGSSLVQAPNWVLGEASPEMAKRYNPRHYPDVYFLIDEEGTVQAVSTAPAATLDKIMRFAVGG